jgi:hypothetical protein
MDMNEFQKMILEKNLTTQDELDKLGLDEVLWGIVPGLEGKCIYEWDAVYFGRFYSYIGDDETGKEFKENTEKALKEFLGEDVEIKEYEEVYPD